MDDVSVIRNYEVSQIEGFLEHKFGRGLSFYYRKRKRK